MEIKCKCVSTLDSLLVCGGLVVNTDICAHIENALVLNKQIQRSRVYFLAEPNTLR
jgi:uncharacterized protein YwlG (UPF0340 family)